MKLLLHVLFIKQLYADTSAIRHRFQRTGEGFAMDDYQEELLEYQAYELDPPEPAEDATEL
ncbi:MULTISPECIES: hypothetical protein [Pseudomonas]|jgi:hypothetical protein|uniref:hypothetical protein n=1 Tax=Pseudomonas TaxID=286 RepID=UPI0008774557|nr:MULTISPECIES: hypothetical protein [Pseudomonas]MDB6446071.1 hypothetical protein [Pseudomonas sp. 21TX0197]MDT8904599.1 hypothetical protein [Pseudomonas prosekii]SCX42517.1 hypothetical protein SAMN03159507_00401 [Pseudomonas sp. NFACC32-1]SFW99249.1 hypothetical protein SAMN03159390_00060 [Pseudomonas sp. NFACC49-2]SFX08158.1 hypothetical protein SAMN03159442_00409 [Pseudomonas sp. NFACC47-1]